MLRLFLQAGLLLCLGPIFAFHAQQPEMFVQHIVPNLSGDTVPEADALLAKNGLKTRHAPRD